MELAALASAAVPALALTGVAGSPDDAADFDSALLVDDAGKQWRVRSPKHVEASMRLETELLVLRAFVPGGTGRAALRPALRCRHCPDGPAVHLRVLPPARVHPGH